MKTRLKEICANCGCTYGAHCAQAYYSDWYNMFIPKNYCPGTQGRMDWDRGPGTVFKALNVKKETQNDKTDNVDSVCNCKLCPKG